MVSPVDHLRTGLEAQSAGRLEAAYRHYLEAARMLLALALESPLGHLRRRRFEQARQVEAMARRVKRRMDERRHQQEVARRAIPTLADEEEVPEWLLAERPDVRLDDVAGLDEVKEQIYLKFVYPFTHPQEARRYGVRPGAGLLLYGPPGVGKTYIARAVAGELDAAFFVARASNLMSQWFGKAEQNVAALFEAARRQDRAVIFLDEIEALLPRRSSTRSSVMPRVVSEFLSQTQSLGTEGGAILLIGATNEPWSVDPAALRPGRFDEVIYVGLPDYEARRRILEMNLRHRPLSPAVDLDALARRLEGYTGADIAYICRKSCERAFQDAVERGIDREVVPEDFDAAMAERKPSVTPEQVRKYEEFRGS
ncbi:MAG: hypothetical protein Kow0047_21850 [Anaerolineae bacterium]